MNRVKVIAVFILVAAFFFACQEDDKVHNYQTTPYQINSPSGFPEMFIHPDNPLTEEGVALGRMLYYDPQLDKNAARACADCHQQKQGFSTYNSNALAHINLAWNDYFLWNGGVKGNLEDAMLFEVEQFFETDLDRINADPNYRSLFKNAFGVNEISSKELAYALAQFERTLYSANSRFDLFNKGVGQLTSAELRGLDLYFSEKGDCFHCHGANLTTDNQFHNNALDSFPDEGRMEVTGDPQDKGKFKTPTLRNIALTAPYMHDGRFKTLEEVVEFYSTGLVSSPTVDVLMKQLHNQGVQLSTQEKADLVAFLHTFTDTSFLNNPALSDPFE